MPRARNVICYVTCVLGTQEVELSIPTSKNLHFQKVEVRASPQNQTFQCKGHFKAISHWAKHWLQGQHM